MVSLRDIDRVVLRHGWAEPVEWAHAIDELANLSDDEIDSLTEAVRQDRLVETA